MLVQRWSQTIRRDTGDAAHLGEHAAAAGANTPAQAAHLAAELARLMDMVETENVPLDGLAALVPDEYSEHWKRHARVPRDHHRLLAGVSRREEAAVAGGAAQPGHPRRGRAPRATRRRPGPVIVAGVTGSVPATVELMARGGAAAAGRHRAAGPRSASRRGELGGDRRASRASAIRLRQAARRPRRRARRRAAARAAPTSARPARRARRSSPRPCVRRA